MRDFLTSARLDGQGYVLLGAGGGGIGNAVAEALAGAGAKLLCVDIDPAQAAEVAKATGGEAHAADIRQRADMQAVFTHAKTLFGERFKGIVDVVGVGRIAPIESFTDEQLQWQFDIVLRHVLLAAQIGAPVLAETGGGTITLVGSRAGIKPAPDQAIYGAFKAALHYFVRVAALEYGPRGIRVNAVSPGFVSTPRVRKALDKHWAHIERINPLGRAADPEDVAKAILFLASDLASYVTGNVLMLDGAGDNNLRAMGLDFALPGTGPG